MVYNILAALQPFIIEALATLIVVIFGMVGKTLHACLGQRSTALLRDTLDKAVTRGIAQARKANPPNKVSHVTQYLQGTIPDTLKRLGATPEALASRVKAQIYEIGG